MNRFKKIVSADQHALQEIVTCVIHRCSHICVAPD